jgi:hypothetical protein
MKRRRMQCGLLWLMVLAIGCGGSKDKPGQAASTSVESTPTPTAMASPTPIPTPASIDLGGGLSGLVLLPGQGTARVLAGDVVELRVRVLSLDRQEIWSGELEHKAGEAGGFPGLDRAVDGMRLGEVRELNVPPDLAFLHPKAAAPAAVTLIVEVTNLKEETQR